MASQASRNCFWTRWTAGDRRASANLQHYWQLLWWSLVLGAVLKPQLEGMQLFCKERAGLELDLTGLGLQHPVIAKTCVDLSSIDA